MKVTVYWLTKNPDTKSRIREKFHLPEGMNINGETVADIREEYLPLLRECERRGFLEIRIKTTIT